MKAGKIIAGIIGVTGLASVIGLAITGWKINWGPFRFLHTWENDICRIEEKYNTSETDESDGEDVQDEPDVDEDLESELGTE